MDSRTFLLSLIVGVLATLTLDVTSIIGFRLGIAGKGPRRSGPDLIGRWFGYMMRGKFKHTDIVETPALNGEAVLGLAAHYVIGILLTLLYIGIVLVAHATPTIPSAVVFGAATVVFPWFIMFPSQGMGWLGRDAPGDSHMTRTSLFNHILFGLGIALWMAILRPF
jgi:hypothetical protein